MDALTSLDGLTALPAIRHLSLHGNAITNVDSLTTLPPSWLDLTGNPLSPAALGIIGDLCRANWAITWDGGSCGSLCIYASCTR